MINTNPAAATGIDDPPVWGNEPVPVPASTASAATVGGVVATVVPNTPTVVVVPPTVVVVDPSNVVVVVGSRLVVVVVARTVVDVVLVDVDETVLDVVEVDAGTVLVEVELDDVDTGVDVLVVVVPLPNSGSVSATNDWSAVSRLLFVETRMRQLRKSAKPFTGDGCVGERQLNNDCGLSPLNGVNA
jgi:hypothetical protein